MFKKHIRVPNTKATVEFYNDLMSDADKRGLLGKDCRFNVEKISGREDIQRHFKATLKSYLNKDMNVLDFGCGPGTFLVMLSDLCKNVTGVDVVDAFVSEAEDNIRKFGIKNARAVLSSGPSLPFGDGEFDAIVLVDVLHHLDSPREILADALRTLRPGGQILIFEPCKLNPVLYLLHLLDRNEWGLLALGSPGKYRTLLGGVMEIDDIRFSGLVVGPSSRVFAAIADFLVHPLVYRWLGWLLPKIFIAGRKVAG